MAESSEYTQGPIDVDEFLSEECFPNFDFPEWKPKTVSRFRATLKLIKPGLEKTGKDLDYCNEWVSPQSYSIPIKITH